VSALLLSYIRVGGFVMLELSWVIMGLQPQSLSSVSSNLTLYNAIRGNLASL
jgi:hypothetical protein